MTTLAVMLTRDRRATVEVCLPAWGKAKRDMRLVVLDDGSTEYDTLDLTRWGADDVVNVPPSDDRGSWRVAQLIRRAFTMALDVGVEWVLIADSDTYPDPGVRSVIEKIEACATHKVYSLYRSSYQEGSAAACYRTQRQHTVSTGLRLLDRARAPGCALLVSTAALRKLGAPFGISQEAWKKNGGTWDHALSQALGPVGVLDISYVDHLGRGGLHNPTWETDQAVNPTSFLARKRGKLIVQIERALPPIERQGARRGVRPATAAERATLQPAAPQPPPRLPARPEPLKPLPPPVAPRPVGDRQRAYEPATYWAERLVREGPGYVGAQGVVAEQAEQFLGALVPALLYAEVGALHGAPPRLLDFGCGTGRLVEALEAAGFEYHGVDVNRGALEVFAARRPALGARLAHGAWPPQPDGFFDVVVAVTVLQHVPERDIEVTCRALARVLAPGGRLFLIEDANPEGAAPALHMSFRTAERYAALLGAELEACVAVDAERPRSHYLATLKRV